MHLSFFSPSESAPEKFSEGMDGGGAMVGREGTAETPSEVVGGGEMGTGDGKLEGKEEMQKVIAQKVLLLKW